MPQWPLLKAGPPPRVELPADIEDWSIQLKDRWHKATKYIAEFERRVVKTAPPGPPQPE